MVSCKLYGRLANQAFQIAATIAYAKKHDLEFHIPKSTLNNKIWEPKFTHLTNPRFNPTLPKVELKEKTHSFHELPFDEEWRRNKNIILDGFWQSELYFKHYIEDIRDYLFIPPIDQVDKNVVAIHVRRGDYVKLQDKHPVVTIKYLRAATLYMQMSDHKHFKIFSDDIDWCKGNIDALMANAVTGRTIEYSEGKTDLNDFYAMTRCGNFIICNSTFSLMAAILCKNPDKFCISPTSKDWFGPGNSNLDTSTIIPETFTQMEY